MEWKNISFNRIVDGVISVHPYFGYHIRAEISSVDVDKNDGKTYASFKFNCACACSIQHKSCIEPIPIQYNTILVNCERCKRPIFRISYFTISWFDPIEWNLQVPKR